jgi:hypothetical protein
MGCSAGKSLTLMIIYYTQTYTPRTHVFTKCLKIAYTQLLKNGWYGIPLTWKRKTVFWIIQRGSNNTSSWYNCDHFIPNCYCALETFEYVCNPLEKMHWSIKINKYNDKILTDLQVVKVTKISFITFVVKNIYDGSCKLKAHILRMRWSHRYLLATIGYSSNISRPLPYNHHKVWQYEAYNDGYTMFTKDSKDVVIIKGNHSSEPFNEWKVIH